MYLYSNGLFSTDDSGRIIGISVSSVLGACIVVVIIILLVVFIRQQNIIKYAARRYPHSECAKRPSMMRLVMYVFQKYTLNYAV